MERNNVIIYILGAIIIIGGIWLYMREDSMVTQNVTTFTECAAAGYPVMESYPRQCSDGKGHTFTENIGNGLEKADLIKVSNITPNQVVRSPLTISGEARGTWYFEASFPVEIQDDKGTVLFQGPAQAQGEWMTENFVPFSITATFDPKTATSGKVILRKDNPSGLPEHEDFLEIPVLFTDIAPV